MNPTDVFKTNISVAVLSSRRLQSIAFHLGVSANISSTPDEKLIIEIGNKLISQYTYPEEHLGPNSTAVVRLPDKLIDEIAKIKTQHHVSKDYFSFLKYFSRKSIIFKLRKTGIGNDLIVRQAFENAQDIDVILGYLCDISKKTANEIAESLMKLDQQLQVMRITWYKYIAWFAKEKDKNMEKLRAAAFYSGKQLHDTAENQVAIIVQRTPRIIIMPTIESYDDIEIFFHNLDYPSSTKVLVFEKIRDLYNTRSSRAENKKNKKKSCSFILTGEAESFIKKLAKERQMKGSALLNTIFQEANKNGLIDLLRNSPNTR